MVGILWRDVLDIVNISLLSLHRYLKHSFFMCIKDLKYYRRRCKHIGGRYWKTSTNDKKYQNYTDRKITPWMCRKYHIRTYEDVRVYIIVVYCGLKFSKSLNICLTIRTLHTIMTYSSGAPYRMTLRLLKRWSTILIADNSFKTDFISDVRIWKVADSNWFPVK